MCYELAQCSVCLALRHKTIMEPESELTGLEFIADLLQPIQLVVWGELAIRYLGVPVVPHVSNSILTMSFP